MIVLSEAGECEFQYQAVLLKALYDENQRTGVWMRTDQLQRWLLNLRAEIASEETGRDLIDLLRDEEAASRRPSRQ